MAFDNNNKSNIFFRDSSTHMLCPLKYKEKIKIAASIMMLTITGHT